MEVKKRKSNDRNYFTQETEDAILLYNKTESPNQQSKIYSQHIHYPFFKLTQNIIHTFKFYYTDVDDLEHLQHQIIVFLLGKMHLYHHSKSIDDRLHKIINKKYSHNLFTKGEFLEYTDNSDKITIEQIREFIKQYEDKVCDSCWKELKRLTPPKAYSYFGTIVKRWCINYNKKNYSKKLNKSSIDELSQSPFYSYDLDERELSKQQLSDFVDQFIDYTTENIYELFPKGNDPKYADAILELFRKRDSLELFNKKALYKNIRETAAIIGFEVKTPKITQVADKLYEIFNDSYQRYLEDGYIEFED